MAVEPRVCRWAALSLSSIAGVFIPDILLPRDSSDAIKHELVAVSTTGTKERAQSWLVDNRVSNPDSVTIFQDWQTMLDDGDFDVVYISTPHPLHYEHVLAALNAKRHVLVEKPATMNAAQFSRLASLARTQGVVLMEAMWTRYLPATRYLQQELLPRIGDVKRVYADFSFPIVSDDLAHSSRFLDKRAGAGSLLDQGVYALTWADIGLHGVESTAATNVQFANTMNVPGVAGEVDDITTVILSKQSSASEQEAVAIVTTSMTLPGSSKPAFYKRLQANKSGPSVRIEGTKATVSIPFPPIRAQQLKISWYDPEHLDEDGMEMEETIEKPVERGWGMWYQADVIAARIAARQGGAEGEIIGYKESLRVLQWMDAARKQAGIIYDEDLERV